MSLLDTASLLLTPNAYKEGKLYSVIPSDGSGDFTFTRATTATRVNSDGLVELVPYNLLSYSEQFDNAAWIKQNGTITPNTIASPSGVSSADTFTDNSTNGAHSIVRYSQWSTTQQTFSIYVKPDTLTKFFIANGSLGSSVFFDLTTLTIEGTITAFSSPMINNTITPMANGWYRLSTTHTGTASQTLQFGSYKVFNPTSLGASATYIGSGETAYLWGAQLVEGTNALPYQKTETRLNIPRLDSSLGGCPSILLEPQRTNLALQSSSFDSATWTKSALTVTANNAISPSGVQDADLITANGATTQHNVLQTIGSGAKTYSVFAKMGTQRYIQILTSGTAAPVANFDLQDGVANMVGSNSTASIEDYGNGWYRCILQTNEAAAANFYVNYVNSLVAPRFQSILSSDTLYLWGAQAEVGAYATSYIGPTTTASVTRNVDTMLLSNIYTNNLITSSGGTWFVDLENNLPLTRDGGGNLFIDTSSSGFSNGWSIRNIAEPNTRLRIVKYIASTSSVNYLTPTNKVKIAIKWNGTTADVFVNGVKVVANTPFTSTNMQFLAGNGSDHSKFISSMLLAPTPLTDDECIQLTTL